MTRHCEHVKSNGHFCGSPAMRGRNYCYFHLNYVGHRLRAEKQAARGQLSHSNNVAFELPLLEDAASVQLALMQVTNAMLQGTLDPKRAGLVLYALQTASINLRNMEKEAKNQEVAAVCNSYDSFERDYDLEDQADELRIDEAVPESSSAAAQPGCNGDGPSESGDLDAKDISGLSERQYRDAKLLAFHYELTHGIDGHSESAKPAPPERAALSQKLFMGLQKSVQSVAVPEEVLAGVNGRIVDGE
jgi:hypothetical protein